MSKRALDEQEQFIQEVGQTVVDLFHLKEMKDHPGMYDTSWGRKTTLGIGRIILRVAKDPKNA